MEKLKVIDMNCEHCVKKIAAALDKAGIDAEICLEEKTIAIDPEDRSEAQKALAAAGYHIAAE